MLRRHTPEVGLWFMEKQSGQKLEVIDVDHAEGLIEVQYFDGTLEEYDLDSWHKLEMEPIEQPEDWTGPFEMEEFDEEDELSTHYRIDDPFQSNDPYGLDGQDSL